ncbi:hypothetical protein DDB_G0270554 [Dictyostelium discoideum AX4]|uniref:Transmembrane protein n=1 Tax=Dictyostelium discoideum TaxID=44689 RepID=Q55DR8_DICDI|nr:hypothetical protein DDB_G0270554 [Dictyostelium discoideum AX4]EAL72627.1 hypothetical protein DDB_G0270554 [Dictyostelium discoideum AX4]|eukprot:XP_646063.1 hypothetical protein DDB_G0270554 [Dictyostelium discoideum AX4]
MVISSDQEQLLSSTEDQLLQYQQQHQQSQLSEQPQHIIPIGPPQNVLPMGKYKIPETFSCNIFTGYENPTTCPTEISNYLSFDEYNSLVISLNNKMDTFHRNYWISFIIYIIVVLLFYCSFFIIYSDKIFLILGLLLTAIISIAFFLNYLQKRNFENIKKICKEYTVQFSNRNIKVETTKKQFKVSVHINYPQNTFVLSQQYLQPQFQQFQPIYRQNICQPQQQQQQQ